MNTLTKIVLKNIVVRLEFYLSSNSKIISSAIIEWDICSDSGVKKKEYGNRDFEKMHISVDAAWWYTNTFLVSVDKQRLLA